MTQSVCRTRGISLRELLPRIQILGAPDIRVQSCSSDSRLVKPGDLFVALSGTEKDGHECIQEALERGAAAVLAERLVPTEGRPICIVPDARRAHGPLCQALFGYPARQLTNIAITGTNGKTSTSLLVASILSTAGAEVGMLGTLGIHSRFCNRETTHTTPPAPMLARSLAEMVSDGCTHSVMEVSSHALSQHRTCGIEYAIGCITNARRDHLDYHGTLGNYHRMKARLVKQLTSEGTLVLNADDPFCMNLAEEYCGELVQFGFDSDADVSATILEQSRSEQFFLLSIGSDTAVVHSRIVGDFHVANCLAAAAIGTALGIPLPTIARGIGAVDQIPGRMERIDCGQPFSVFVDYAHTPDALEAILASIAQVTEDRVICVFGAGGDRDPRKRVLMGAAVERGAHLAIVTTDNPRNESLDSIAQDILDGFGRRSAAVRIDDRAEAIQFALRSARPGDSVVIAGKGHESHQIIGREKLAFDDRRVARELLYRMQAPLLKSG